MFWYHYIGQNRRCKVFFANLTENRGIYLCNIANRNIFPKS
nr:MAG TPA: hypothetical protein [Caudoviricetes sp.]